MPANKDVAILPFTKEEQEKYSPILKLRKANSAHFRREFTALGEEQARFMEFMDMKRTQVENEAASKTGAPILNGFRLSGEPQPIPGFSDAPRRKGRRCTLL